MTSSSRMVFARHPVALTGAVITTLSGLLFVVLAIAMSVGLLVNPYAGLMVFVALPAAFVIGLILIPIGVRLGRRWERRHPGAPVWPILDFSHSRTRHVALAVLVLTGVNLVIVLLAGYGTMQWMESPSFCGQVCHAPMHPQFTAWQNAPHSNVTCVQCHIGEGGSAFLHYKMAGVRQLLHVVTNNYPRPIPAVADMRPALETCGTCHWSGRSLGNMLHVSHQYGDDEANSDTVTAMMLHVGGPGAPTTSGRAIHWHADPAVRVEYVATDDARQTIPWVRVTKPDGSVKEYAAEGVTAETFTAGERRVMDCLDCHNVVAHRIAPSAEQAVDLAMASGRIPRSLPYVRREGVKLVRSTYSSTEAALAAIEEGLRGFYKTQSGQIDGQALGRAVETLQTVYRRNVFPTMNVTFGVYADNIGHTSSQGCLRCHDDSHTAKDGSTISGDCETCHTMLDAPP
jgi:nitrate/TMAO reductase-like tetraheme cytochrome c subunit